MSDTEENALHSEEEIEEPAHIPSPRKKKTLTEEQKEILRQRLIKAREVSARVRIEEGKKRREMKQESKKQQKVEQMKEKVFKKLNINDEQKEIIDNTIQNPQKFKQYIQKPNKEKPYCKITFYEKPENFENMKIKFKPNKNKTQSDTKIHLPSIPEKEEPSKPPPSPKKAEPAKKKEINYADLYFS